MKSFDFMISEDYVSHWTVYDALREFFQNAIDAGNWEPHYEDEVLTIWSIGTSLPLDSLLLGRTTKENSSSKLGQFGEGYKLAMLVLRRLGYVVTIITEVEGKEVTIYPSLVYNESFGVKTLRVDVQETGNIVENKFVGVEIVGISEEKFENYMNYNLNLLEYDHFTSSGGQEVLTEEQHRGKVYVEGLFVTNYESLTYGYNLKAGDIPLDRDRQKVSGFDLKYKIAGVLATLESDVKSKVLTELIEADADDIEYIYARSYDITETVTELWQRYYENYGKAVPVRSEREKMELQKEYKNIHCVTLPSAAVALMEYTDEYDELLKNYEKNHTPTPKEFLMQWFDEHEDLIPKAAAMSFMNEVVTVAEGWKNN